MADQMDSRVPKRPKWLEGVPEPDYIELCILSEEVRSGKRMLRNAEFVRYLEKRYQRTIPITSFVRWLHTKK